MPDVIGFSGAVLPGALGVGSPIFLDAGVCVTLHGQSRAELSRAEFDAYAQEGYVTSLGGSLAVDTPTANLAGWCVLYITEAFEARTKVGEDLATGLRTAAFANGLHVACAPIEQVRRAAGGWAEMLLKAARNALERSASHHPAAAQARQLADDARLCASLAEDQVLLRNAYAAALTARRRLAAPVSDGSRGATAGSSAHELAYLLRLARCRLDLTGTADVEREVAFQEPVLKDIDLAFRMPNQSEASASFSISPHHWLRAHSVRSSAFMSRQPKDWNGAERERADAWVDTGLAVTPGACWGAWGKAALIAYMLGPASGSYAAVCHRAVAGTRARVAEVARQRGLSQDEINVLVSRYSAQVSELADDAFAAQLVSLSDKGFDTYQPDAGTLKSWLRTGLLRKALKDARRAAQKLAAETSVGVEELAIKPPPLNLEELIRSTDRQSDAVIWTLFSKLEPIDRETLDLVVLQELDYDEAGRTSSKRCSANSMKTRASRAKQRLRSLWADHHKAEKKS